MVSVVCACELWSDGVSWVAAANAPAPTSTVSATTAAMTAPRERPLDAGPGEGDMAPATIGAWPMAGPPTPGGGGGTIGSVSRWTTGTLGTGGAATGRGRSHTTQREAASALSV